MKRYLKISTLFAVAFFTGIPWTAKGQEAPVNPNSELIIQHVQTAAANVEAAAARVEAERARLEEEKSALKHNAVWITSSGDSMTIDATLRSKPKLGVYLSNLDFKDAYEQHYPHNYGVMVSGVVKGGASETAGIVEGDIIMTFDSVKVLYDDQLVRLIQSKKIGDAVPITIFRNEGEQNLTVTLSPSSSSGGTIEGSFTFDTGKESKSVGYGGGGWTPTWMQLDLSDVNGLLTDLNFDSIGSKGILLQGGGGHGNVGNGWFLGGQGIGYTLNDNVGMWAHNGADSTYVTRQLNLNLGIGGVTLDKRFALSKKLIPSLGIMLGGGSYNLKITQTDGAYNWSTVNQDFESTANSAIEISRDYILVQPRVGLLIRVLPWMSIRAEGGYAYGYSWYKGWKATVGDNKYTVKNSPDTDLQGATASLGVWFGF